MDLTGLTIIGEPVHLESVYVSDSTVVLHSTCKNVCVKNSSNVFIGKNSSNIFISESKNVKVGDGTKNVQIDSDCDSIQIGNDCGNLGQCFIGKQC